MKRSEALEFIRNELYGKPYEDWENQILTTVEKMGMLPPGVFKEVPTAEVESIDQIKGLINFKIGQSFGTVNEWDEE